MWADGATSGPRKVTMTCSVSYWLPDSEESYDSDWVMLAQDYSLTLCKIDSCCLCSKEVLVRFDTSNLLDREK